jgi:hypothetical protein
MKYDDPMARIAAGWLFVVVLLGCTACDREGETAYAPVAEVQIEAHTEVATVLEVSWQQVQGADAGWLEFQQPGSSWQASPAVARAAGAQREVVLGVAPSVEVEVRIVNEIDGERLTSERTWTASTGALPVAELEPWVAAHDQELVTGDTWLLGSVEITSGQHLEGPFWTFVLDRAGRVVWYHAAPDDRSVLFPRIARDGTHLVMDQGVLFSFEPEAVAQLQRMTLDHGFSEVEEVPGLAMAWDVTDDGAVLFDDDTGFPDVRLVEQDVDGSRRTVFDCTAWMGDRCEDSWCCSTNAIVWVPHTDTVLYSMWSMDTVLEIARDDGEVVRQFGVMDGSWAFDPPEAAFDLQHYPHYTPTGTLLVSTHIPDEWYVQRVREFSLDRDTETLVEVWAYGDADDPFADLHGEAIRLDDGNTLINYGTEGVLREVTPNGETAWEVRWPEPYAVGHLTVVDDLYALNVGR